MVKETVKNVEKENDIMIQNRKKIVMTGVVEIFTFTDQEAVVNTTKGVINIKGNSLHLERFNLETNDMHATGKIDSVVYKEKYEKRKNSFWNWFLK